MPRAASKQAREARNRLIREGRAVGRSFRQLAKLHGVSPALAYRVAGDVYMQFLSPWHRKRLHEEPCTQSVNLHGYLAPR